MPAAEPPATMWASVWTAYGPPSVLAHRRVPVPRVSDHAVLVRVKAAGVATGDTELREMRLPSFAVLPLKAVFAVTRPTSLGQSFAGTVEKVGGKVTRFKPGDAVFGAAGFSFGAHAEYLAVSTTGSGGTVVAHKPAGLSFVDAAAVGLNGLEALAMLRQAGLSRRESLLVVGAGGGIGTLASQIAKARYGAAKVDGVDGTAQLAALQKAGFDEAIDRIARPEWYSEVPESSYDVVLDLPGKLPFSQTARLLKENGRRIAAMFPTSEVFSRRSAPGGRKSLLGSAGYSQADLDELAGMLGRGEVRPVVDRTFPLAEAAAAHEYSESGRKRGSIVLVMDEGGK
ncbi:chaperonin 10-like protein [Hyaloraphidium curvatum]|nr:chaperonin 10-like protein [Hyaloraphidium curvatum]